MPDRKFLEKVRFNAYRRLASRIIAIAVEDWKDSVQVLREHPKDQKSLDMVSECERFFASSWYQDLRELSWNDFPYDMKSKLEEMVYGH